VADHSTTVSEHTAPKSFGDPLRLAWRKSYLGLTIIGIFSVFINLLKLTIPLYVLQILDRVVASRSIETLVMLTAITVTAIFCAVLLEIIRRRMFIHWGSWIEFRFGPTLFTAGLKTVTGQTPTTSKLIRDIGTVRSFVSGTGLIAWLDAIWAPLFIVCTYLISPILGYIVFIACLLALILGVLNEYITRDSREATYKARQGDRDWIDSAERNQETVESLNMAMNFADRWSSNAFTKLDQGMRGQNFHLYFAAAMILIARFLRVAVFGVGIWLVINQSLTLGSVIAVNVLGRIAYSLVQNAMLRWREVVTAKRAYSRIKSSLHKLSETRVSLPIALNDVALTIENVRYRYPGKASSILRNISLVLNPGELLVVVGPSASGKTTFSRLAAGLLPPRDGNVRLGDVDVFRLQQRSQCNEIGKLSQDITLFPGTVRENIARMSDGEMDRVIQAAKYAGIHDTIIDLPAGYDTEIGENEPLLSFGQRKGLALARAFYGEPLLVVLDEPIPHLDNQAHSKLLNGIRELNKKGTIIILTTQSNSLCKYADKVLVLDDFKHHLLKTQKDILLFHKEGEIKGPNQRKRDNRKNKKLSSVTTSHRHDDNKQRSA
jgi:PrtD family type I secretion system ABC transporter